MLRGRLRTRRSRIVAGVLAVVLLWVAVSSLLVWRAQAAMRDGRDSLDTARSEVSANSLLDSTATTDAQLGDALSSFESAGDSLDNPVLLPARALPVIGRHLKAAKKVNNTAAQATSIAREALAKVRALSKNPPSSGPARVRLINQLTATVESARQDISRLDPGSSKALIGPLADAVDQIRNKQIEVVESLGRAVGITKALEGVLAGPDTYLLIGANNAEMRSGSGMFLTAAPLSFDNGEMALGEVQQTAKLANAPVVPVGGDMAKNWSWLDPGSDMRQLAMSPNFPDSAAVAKDFWKTVPGGGPVAGVMVIDIDGLRSLLKVVGPLKVEGITYSADTVRHELLVEQYRRAADDWQARKERHDQIGAVAQAAFERIQNGEWKADDLASALIDMVQRRHLMIWSADPLAQKAWVDAGAAGSLQPESISVALANRAANKLDPYLQTKANIVTSEGGGRVEVTYTITSTAPTGGPEYQVGPHVPGLSAGGHRAVVVANLPQGSSELVMTGARQFLTGGDGPTRIVAGELDVRPGQTVTVKISARLPKGLEHMVIEPSARIPKTTWEFNGKQFDTDRRRTVSVPRN